MIKTRVDNVDTFYYLLGFQPIKEKNKKKERTFLASKKKKEHGTL